jgi:hypothetical protein
MAQTTVRLPFVSFHAPEDLRVTHLMLGLRLAIFILERDLCFSVISHNVGDEETSFITFKPELVRSRHIGAGHFERRSSPSGNLAEKEVCCDENCFYITKVVKVATFNEKIFFYLFSQ